MTAIMVQGTSSSAGKSFLVTALCRILARRGIRAAPFKAVNMSNNARVVNGLEMPTAQYFQAIAAGIEPDVRMAPILVKPEAGGSQVVVMGKVDRHLSAMAWQDRPVHQWPVVTSALRWVQDNYDVVVIEGAGSPAEVNCGHWTLSIWRLPEKPTLRCFSSPTSIGVGASLTSTERGRCSTKTSSGWCAVMY